MNYSDENVDDFFSNFNTDSSLRTILNGESPVWLSLLQKNVDSRSPIVQMKQGLNWAQVLGDAAKNGFKVIYSPINKHTWNEPSMTYYTTLLHKRIIGQTVFDTTIFNGNRYDTHFYAHCTKNMSGSFSLFGVNSADTSMNVNAKLPFRSGTEYMEFILTVGYDGRIYLNGAEIIEPTVLTPVQKYKLPGKGAMMSMPPHSVAFWVFTSASIPECSSIDAISPETEQTQQRTSSELLLQQLVVETVKNDERNPALTRENSIPRSKRHTISSKDGMINRIRRDTENQIDKHSEYNAIEMDEYDSDLQSRDKRFIGDAKFTNRVYNGDDDLKRRNLVASYRTKMITKRMKRDINMLKNLFDKFDLKKSPFNFKVPPLVRGKSFIPSISTVHDVLNPAKPSVENKIFEHVDNLELPTGDVHFEIAAAVTEPNEYAAALNAANNIVEKPSVLSAPSDMFSNAGFASPTVLGPSRTNAVPSSILLGELTEMDIQSELATVAPIQTPSPIPEQNSMYSPSVQVRPMQNIKPVQPTPSTQHQLQFVVKDLPPTLQVNRENMEKTRNNLRQNLWPMNFNTQNTNPAITAFLPNVAQYPNIQPDEHILFESKRRRRSIDSKMNEEIEKRVQHGKNEVKSDVRLDQAIDHVELFDKFLGLINDLEHSQAYEKSGKFSEKKLTSGRTISLESGKSKKCKVLSMAMEKQCLEDEGQPKSIFKRAVESKRTKASTSLKKFIAKIKETVEKPLKFRTRRSADSEENEINSILKEVNEEAEMHLPHKNIYQKRRYDDTNQKPSKEKTTTTSTTEDYMQLDSKNENGKPKFLRTIRKTMNNILTSVAQHIASAWVALS